MVVFARTAATLRALLETPAGVSVADFDTRLRESAARDARDTAENFCSAVTGRDAPAGPARARKYSVMSALGPIDIRYRYASGSGGFKAYRRAFDAGGHGDVKATRHARAAMARCGAQLGSFAEASSFLADIAGMPVSAGTARKATLSAGVETERAWEGGGIGSCRAATPPRRLPPDAVRVGPTVAVSIDGTGVNCLKADTRGIAGRNGGRAHTREVKVMWAAWYEYVDGNGRPLTDPSRTFMRVAAGTAAESEAKLWATAKMAGYGGGTRTQFITDGAAWAENMHGSAFFDSERTVDFFHACGYLATLVEAVAPEGRSRQMFAMYRKMLLGKSGGYVCDTFRRRHRDKIALLPEDAAKALKYLESRRDAMDYGRLAKMGFYIASGCIESACKYLVCARCKQAGMHWRLKNAVAVAMLRATIRSHLKIIA